jgi:hypothetical protein
VPGVGLADPCGAVAKRICHCAGIIATKKRPATQWVAPSVKLRIKHLRGDHSHIRHASLQDFWDED